VNSVIIVIYFEIIVWTHKLTILDVIAYGAFSSSYVSLEMEPKSYVESATDSRWVNAMQEEITALNNNHT